jgi:RNA polymerase sigma-70 factor (ECF subfamily)
MDSSDNQLLLRWAERRDAEAFRELAMRYAGLVYGTSRRILRDAHEAEDVAQECFIQLATGKLRNGTSLGAWLHRVATNLSINRLRSRNRAEAREEQYARETGQVITPVWDDISPLIDEAINALPERLRLPLVLHFFEGQTHDTIATELRVSRSAITQRIHAAVESVREGLKSRRIDVTAIALFPLLTDNLVRVDISPTLQANISKIAIAGLDKLNSSHRGTSAKMGLRIVAAMLPFALLCAAAVYFVNTRLQSISDTRTVDRALLAKSTLESVNGDNQPRTSQKPANPVDATKPNSAISAPIPEQTKSEFVLHGVVADADGYGIEDARVLIWPETGATFPPKQAVVVARANNTGQYALYLSECPAAATITVSAKGYDSSVIDQFKFAALPKRDNTELNFVLNPGSELLGILIGPNGTPATNALVLTRHIQYEMGYMDGLDVATTTDETGYFCLNYAKTTTAVDIQVCTANGESDAFLGLPVGETEPLKLQMRNGVSITGSVTPGGVQPESGTAVWAYTALREWFDKSGNKHVVHGQMISAPVHSDGTYELNGLPARYSYVVLLVSPAGFTVSCDDEKTPVLEPGTRAQLDLICTSPIRVRGHALMESSKESMMTRVYFVSTSNPAAEVSTFTKANGAYELSLPTLGTYRAYTQVDQFWDIPFDSKFEKVVEIAQQETVVDLDIPEMFRVPVRVIDADQNPLPGAEVSLSRLRVDGSGPIWSPQLTSNAGRTVLKCFPDHEFWVRAHMEGFITAESATMRARDGEVPADLTLLLRRPGNITARLIDVKGVPLPKCSYQLRATGSLLGTENFMCSSTDENGRINYEKALRSDRVHIDLKAEYEGKMVDLVDADFEGPTDEGLDLGTIVVGEDNAAVSPGLR